MSQHRIQDSRSRQCIQRLAIGGKQPGMCIVSVQQADQQFIDIQATEHALAAQCDRLARGLGRNQVFQFRATGKRQQQRRKWLQQSAAATPSGLRLAPRATRLIRPCSAVKTSSRALVSR